MASVVKMLSDKKLITVPHWLPNNTHYEVITGSVAYGVSSDTSDMDVYGFAIPPKTDVFPHLAGQIIGFGTQIKPWDEYEKHHIEDVDRGKEYDLKIMSIIKFFELCRQGNANMIDCLFVPQNCILSMTQVGNLVRENRKEFLSKLCWKTFKGYAYNQLKSMKNKEPEGKRKLLVDKYGYDVKFAYNVVRMLNEVEQILTIHDLDLQENNEQLKAIRRGDWAEQEVHNFFARKEVELESVMLKSTLREKPDEVKLKNLLLDCLEAHYGSLEKAIVRQDEELVALRDIDQILNRLKAKQILQ